MRYRASPVRRRTWCCYNAGAALYTANIAKTLRDGIELARATIASGATRKKVDESGIVHAIVQEQLRR